MRQTFAAAWALGLTTLAFAQAPEIRLATYDARSLLRAYDPTVPPPRMPLHAAFPRGFALSPTPAPPMARAIEEEPLLAILRTAVRTHGAEVSISSGHVFVKGPPAAHEAVAALMTHLGRTLLQELTIEVYALAAAPDAPTGVLTAAEAEHLVAAKTPPVELARASMLLDQPGRVRAGKAISFVGDYDVEVANGAAIADPQIAILQEGLDFHATVGQAADGRLLVRFGCTRAALAEALTARAVGSPHVGDIQLPKVRSTVVVGSGFVEDGGALVVRHEGGVGSGTLVRVRKSAAPAPGAPGVEHQVIFADDLLGRPVRVAIPQVRDDSRKAEPPAPENLMTFDAMEEGGAVTRELLEGPIRTAIGDSGGSSFEIIGSRFHLDGPEAAAARVRELLAGLAKGLSKSFVVDFRIGKVDLAGQPGPTNADDLVAKLATSAAVVSASCDQFLVAAGLDQAAIIDQDAEIAEKSQIADPIVGVLFSGYVISGLASAPTPDRIELALDVQHQEVFPFPNTGFPLRAENVGPVDLPQIDTAGGRYRLLLEPGKWSIVTASNPSEGSTLVILARARWQ